MRPFLVLAMTALFASSAVAAESPKIKVERRTDSAKVRRAVVLDRDEVARTPTWNPESGWPNLSLTAALAGAAVKMIEEHSKFDNFEIEGISLKPFRDASLPDRWYLVLDFNPVVDGKRLMSFGTYYAVVLGDASVHLPQEWGSEDGWND